MKFAIIGDSHVSGIRKALAYDDIFGDDVKAHSIIADRMFSFPRTLKPFFGVDGATIRFSEPAATIRCAKLFGRDHLSAATAPLLVVSMAYTTTVFVRSGQWRRFRPWSVCGARHRPLSDAVVEAMALGHFEHILGFFAALKAIGVDCLALEAPPPRPDDPYIGRTISAEAVIVVDRIARRAVAKALGGLGVETVPNPVHRYGLDRKGFLQERFWQKSDRDYHHANADFGCFQLAAVLHHLEKRENKRAEGRTGATGRDA